MADVDAISLPADFTSELLDKMPHWENRLDVLAARNHHATWCQLQSGDFAIRHCD